MEDVQADSGVADLVEEELAVRRWTGVVLGEDEDPPERVSAARAERAGCRLAR
jgi:hypothetical protein